VTLENCERKSAPGTKDESKWKIPRSWAEGEALCQKGERGGMFFVGRRPEGPSRRLLMMTVSREGA